MSDPDSRREFEIDEAIADESRLDMTILPDPPSSSRLEALHDGTDVWSDSKPTPEMVNEINRLLYGSVGPGNMGNLQLVIRSIFLKGYPATCSKYVREVWNEMRKRGK